VAQLTHPRFQIVKRYVVRLAAELTPEAQKQMIRGIRDEGELLRVLEVRSLGGCRYELFLNEGKKREIRRLTAALGAPTLELERLAVGALELGNLPRGEWRKLTPQEVQAALHASPSR
jgi:pseudouridine synthase